MHITSITQGILTATLSYVILQVAQSTKMAWFRAPALPFGNSKDIVDVGYVSYSGNRSYPHTVAYLGIPYAEPPLGNLRFRAPLPLNITRIHTLAAGRVVDATEYPPPCVQGTTGQGDAGGYGDEDCLKVNVYAPASATQSSRFPVLVYIHGGGYIYGNPKAWPFDHWVEQSPNIIVVSIYYRLGAFGFLSIPSFASEPSSSSPGTHNVGILDQKEALRWVQRYISAFGGDPNQVTISGQSAGGQSVMLHLLDQGTNETLFQRAISQSPFRTAVPSPTEQKPLFEYLAQASGCRSITDESRLSCLREATVSTLSRAQDQSLYNFTGYNYFRPVLDGHSIVEYPSVSFLHGRFKHIPLLVGTCSNETMWSPGTDYRAFMRAFYPKLSARDLNNLENAYNQHDFISEEQRAATLMGESVNICANTIISTAWAKGSKSRVFTYRYDQPNPVTGNDAVGHSAENWMMFRGTNLGFNGTATFTPQTDLERKFATELIAYWLSFVRSGDPSTYRLPGTPHWMPYNLDSENSRRRMVLRQDGASILEEEPMPERKRCDVVAELVKKEQN